MKHSVGRNIARLRLSQGMTQERLAQRMGVTPQAVSKWENDLNYPDVAALPALAALLGIVALGFTVPEVAAQLSATFLLTAALFIVGWLLDRRRISSAT